MIEIAAILALGALDRWRGDAAGIVSRSAEKALYGWLVAAVAGHPFDWLAPPIVTALFAGMSPGWGEPLGALIERRHMEQDRLEWWQRSRLLRISPLAAVIARGAIWGAPVLPLAWFDPALLHVALAYLIAVPLAPYLFRDWEIQEFVRGAMAGALILWLNAQQWGV